MSENKEEACLSCGVKQKAVTHMVLREKTSEQEGKGLSGRKSIKKFRVFRKCEYHEGYSRRSNKTIEVDSTK
ncbi:hypothetical protein CSUI_009175 [Cystoisospora suis]|uniref:Uncharacterized protein n=1 Tax=Cystoisospora suis TaxID=483139 RepID=A0A2C6KK46_9APIC|nr:hypothetical protein CSUI_009175 [Cystoisospora suis]